ncbi:O-Antigen ligase [Corynebacterium comes]|uniref:O-Antigen ligase n=2 Tax=Corynebacterium comes TaxID=2675218 RepID=A0A6B8WGH0_9CORY|nr:O-Antigen ligase [Corynebacterium comes]
MTAIVVTAVLGVLLFLLAARRPQWGLIAVAALVPFHGLLLIMPVAAPFWKEAAVLAVATAGFFASRPRERFTVAPWLTPALVLVLAGAVSALVVLGTAAAFPVKIAFFYLIPAVVVYFFPFTRADKDLLVSVLMGTGLFSALFGLWQQVAGGYRLATLGYEWNEQIRTAGPLLRSFGTFNQPFPFGFYMMLVLTVAGAAALAQPGRLRSRLFWVTAPILLLAMASSVVRASFLGLLVAVVVVGVVLHRRLLGYFAALLGVALFLVPVALLADRQGVLATMVSSSSLQQRGGHWSLTLPQMLVRPFGGGLGTTGSSAEKVAETVGPLVRVYQPDNQYLKIGLELGVWGLFLYGVVVAVAVVVLRRLIRVQEDVFERGFTAGVLGVTVAACVAAGFSTYLEIFPLDFYFWLLLACAASVSRGEAALVGGWSPVGRPVPVVTVPPSWKGRRDGVP